MSNQTSQSGIRTSRRTLLRNGAAITGASALGLSGFTGTALAGCNDHKICPKSPGYWKRHWPDDVTISINTCTLEEGAAQAILNTPPRGGNKCLIMLFQLIAAKVNIRAGAPECSAVETAIREAETFVAENGCLDGSCTVGEVHSWNGAEQYKDALDAYNNGQLCECTLNNSNGRP